MVITFKNGKKMVNETKKSYTACATQAAEVADRFRNEFNWAVDRTTENPGNPAYDIGWYVGTSDDASKTAKYLDVFCREFHERFQLDNTPLVVKPIIDNSQKDNLQFGIQIKNPHTHINYAKFVWPIAEINTLGDLHVLMTDVGYEEVLDQFEHNRALKEQNLKNIVGMLRQCETAGMIEDTQSDVLIQDIVLMDILSKELGYKDAAESLDVTVSKIQNDEISIHDAVLEALLVSHDLYEAKDMAKDVTPEQARQELLQTANKKKEVDR